MYSLMASMSPLVVVYFVLIVVLGGFFVVNLFLAVIFEETLSVSQSVSQPASQSVRLWCGDPLGVLADVVACNAAGRLTDRLKGVRQLGG